MRVECSVGDLVDRLTILEIKAVALEGADPRREFVDREKQILLGVLGAEGIVISEDDWRELRGVNQQIWNALDVQRQLDRAGNFGLSFVEVSRLVYQLNDKRAELKARINTDTDSLLREVKVY